MHNNNEIRLVKVFVFINVPRSFIRGSHSLFSHMGNVKSDIPCIFYIPSLFLQFNFKVTSTTCLYLLRTFDFDEKVTITELISYFPQWLENFSTFHNAHHFYISIEKWSHYSLITIYFEKMLLFPYTSLKVSALLTKR